MEGNIMAALILNPKVKQQLDSCFFEVFQTMPERYFSAPGRTEISGNHTDHQHGCVLAGAVNLDTVAAVRVNGINKIRIQSKGYPSKFFRGEADSDDGIPIGQGQRSFPLKCAEIFGAFFCGWVACSF